MNEEANHNQSPFQKFITHDIELVGEHHKAFADVGKPALEKIEKLCKLPTQKGRRNCVKRDSFRLTPTNSCTVPETARRYVCTFALQQRVEMKLGVYSVAAKRSD